MASLEQQIRFCTTSDGVRIAYATVGEGPPLVWIPGWVSHLELMWEYEKFRRSVEALAKHFLYVRYDKRGTGLSDREVSDFSLEARLRDLEAVVEALKLRRLSLNGVSEGGPLAIAYVARHPRRVNRLALYGTFARGSAWSRQTIDALAALVRAQWGLGSETMTNIFAPGATREEVEARARFQRAAATAADAAAMLQANVDTDVSHLLSRVKAPTLVVHARGERAVPFEQGREIAGSIPHARLVPIESDRHSPDAETVLQIQKVVLEFLLEGEEEAAPGAGASAQQAAGPLTILFTDIEGSTSLTQRLGDARAREVLRTHERLVRDALKAHGGAEVKTMGDGFMASFASASRALECAIAIQRAFAERNRGVGAALAPPQGAASGAPTEPVRVRIGLNAGEPIAEEEDLFGTAVIVAARIAAKAQGGEVLASDVVRQLVAGKDFLFADLGETALRGFEDPVRIFEVRWR